MDRRKFIKSSAIALGCSYLAGGAKIWYDNSPESTMLEGFAEGIPLKKEYLSEMYRNKSELPKKLNLEACSLCQLRCPGCALRNYPETTKKTCGFGYLTFKNFKKLIDDNDIEEIELSNTGEIFLNPEIIDIIKYAYENNVALIDHDGVNLNYLTDEMAEALVLYDVQVLTVSIDGASPESYPIYRRGGDFNTVINNIKKINYYKKLYNSDNPHLIYKFILFGHNEHEIDKAKKLAKELDMEIGFKQNYLKTFSPIKNIELAIQKTGLDVRRDLDFDQAKIFQKDRTDWFFCKGLWERPQINWDGQVLGCCKGFFHPMKRNIFKDGLLNALNTPEMVYAKNMLTGKAPPIKGIQCTDCVCYKWVKEMKLNVKPINVLL